MADLGPLHVSGPQTVSMSDPQFDTYATLDAMESRRKVLVEGTHRDTGRRPDAGLLFLARRGVAEAQFRLGELYRVGEGGVPRDPSAAVRWCRAAAEQDHLDAQIRLAEAYYRGEGESQDTEEAARWFRAAAEWGHEDARLRLGMMYADAEADMYDDPEAEDRLEVAALAGHEPARYLLLALRAEQDHDGPDEDDDPDDGVGYLKPWMYSNPAKCGHLNEDSDGDGPSAPDPEEIRTMAEELLQRAWAGNVDAQCGVALAYRCGLGVAKDAGEAIRWFRKAAGQGDGAAKSNLGVMHYYGEGFPEPDHEAALWWFQAAAGRGNPRGLFNLGGMHYNGDGGLSPDPVKAVQLVRKASERGYPEAQNSLGAAYHNGDGIERNEEKSVYWFRDAAALGSWNARYNLGALYACGKGGLGSNPRRFSWVEVAAEGGYAPARFVVTGRDPVANWADAKEWLKWSDEDALYPARSDLGMRFIGGNGYEDDPVEAMKWWHYDAMKGRGR